MKTKDEWYDEYLDGDVSIYAMIGRIQADAYKQAVEDMATSKLIPYNAWNETGEEESKSEWKLPTDDCVKGFFSAIDEITGRDWAALTTPAIQSYKDLEDC